MACGLEFSLSLHNCRICDRLAPRKMWIAGNVEFMCSCATRVWMHQLKNSPSLDGLGKGETQIREEERKRPQIKALAGKPLRVGSMVAPHGRRHAEPWR